MATPLTPNRCRSCGASSYRRLVHRGADGTMRYGDTYRCSGCSLEFTKLASWRERRVSPRVGSAAQPARNEASGMALAMFPDGDEMVPEAAAKTCALEPPDLKRGESKGNPGREAPPLRSE